jgi:hypothetical protein
MLNNRDNLTGYYFKMASGKRNAAEILYSSLSWPSGRLYRE